MRNQSMNVPRKKRRSRDGAHCIHRARRCFEGGSSRCSQWQEKTTFDGHRHEALLSQADSQRSNQNPISLIMWSPSSTSHDDETNETLVEEPQTKQPSSWQQRIRRRFTDMSRGFAFTPLTSFSMPALASKSWDASSDGDSIILHKSKSWQWTCPRIVLDAQNLEQFLVFAMGSEERKSTVQYTLIDLELDLSNSNPSDFCDLPDLQLGAIDYKKPLIYEFAEVLSSMLSLLKELLDGCRRLKRYSYRSSPSLDAIMHHTAGMSIRDMTLTPMMGMGSLRILKIDTTQLDCFSPLHHLCPVVRQFLCNVSELHLTVHTLCPRALIPGDRDPIPLQRLYITILPPPRDDQLNPRGLAVRCGSTAMSPYDLVQYEAAMKKKAVKLAKQMRNPEIVSIEMPVVVREKNKFSTYLKLRWNQNNPKADVVIGYESFNAVSKASAVSRSSFKNYWRHIKWKKQRTQEPTPPDTNEIC